MLNKLQNKKLKYLKLILLKILTELSKQLNLIFYFNLIKNHFTLLSIIPMTTNFQIHIINLYSLVILILKNNKFLIIIKMIVLIYFLKKTFLTIV
jgi:hypothetical protein